MHFSNECVSIKELKEFLPIGTMKEDVPYCWSNMVSSLDGIISFGETNHSGPFEISLGHLKGAASVADERILNYGWATSDAILITGEIVRKESNLTCQPK